MPRVWVCTSASSSQTWGYRGSCFSSPPLYYSRYSTPQEAVKGEIMWARSQVLDTKYSVVKIKNYYIVKIHCMWNTKLRTDIKLPKLPGLIHSFLTTVCTALHAHIIYIYLVTINNTERIIKLFINITSDCNCYHHHHHHYYYYY